MAPPPLFAQTPSFTQVVIEVELRSGPSPVSGSGTWRLVRAYPLG